MAPIVVRAAVSRLHLKRSFHSTSTARASILFALGALSNSRETQHFNKMSKLERVEHSPNLKLIQTSEIKPFPCPTPQKPLQQIAPWTVQRSINAHVEAAAAAQNRPARSDSTVSKIWDNRALAAGRAVLADVARERRRMRRVLERTRRREEKQHMMMRKELDSFAEERRRMRNEMRAAGAWILVSVAAATGLAMYVFWPPRGTLKDNGDMGRNIAARAKAAIPLPAASLVAEQVPATTVVTGEPTVAAPTVLTDEAKTPARGWSMRSLFWKQD